jgi:hypothetical protein
MLASGGGKPAMLELNPQGGYSFVGFGTPSTRRFSNGGDVSMIDMGQGANLSPLARYANGGEVLPSDAQGIGPNNPKVEINITINNEGQVTSKSSQESGGNKGDQSFADMMGKAVEQKVIEVISKQNRIGGTLFQEKRRTAI